MSRFASSLLVLLSLLAGPALADGGTSFSHRMAQGQFFLDGGLATQAMIEFEKASEMEAGKADPQVHHFLARAAWMAGEPGVAMEAIRRARALAGSRPDPDLLSLHEFLTTRFGKVLVIGGGAEGAQIPEPAVPLLDPELKRIYELSLTAITGPQGGSTSVYLPVGAYRVGGHLVEVVAAATTRMDLRGSVGSTRAGVYGEGTGPVGPVSTGAPLQHHLAIVGGGAGATQQGDGAGSGRLIIAWEPWLAEVVGLRVGVSLGLGRLERIQEGMSAPTGGVVGGHVAGGALLPAGQLLLGPWVAFEAGYGGVVAGTEPAGYQGPGAYAVYGPDASFRVVLPSLGPVRGSVEAGVAFREFLPIEAPRDQDDPPHYSIGGGATVTLLVGPQS